MPTTDNTTLLVTGGAGFIGSALIRLLIRETDCHVVNVDKLTYAGNLESLAEAAESERYTFEQVDICVDMNFAWPLEHRCKPDTISFNL